MEMKTLGEFIKHSRCEKCGSPNTGVLEVHLRYHEPNNSIQARCGECGGWIGNVKYDSAFDKSRANIK